MEVNVSYGVWSVQHLYISFFCGSLGATIKPKAKYGFHMTPYVAILHYERELPESVLRNLSEALLPNSWPG